MTDVIIWLLWTAALLGVGLVLAYRRIDLPTSTLTLGGALFVYSLFGSGWAIWKLLLWVLFAGLVAINSIKFRRERITLPLLRFYRTVVPQLSDTEREALEAGTVWWDGELFTGRPDWGRLMALPAPHLSPEERAFLDGPTEELCRLSDDWQITHELADLPPQVWSFIRQHRFFAMIIPKRYGGLEFSPIAVAAVLAKLSIRSARQSCCCTTGPMNSVTTTCRGSPAARRFPALR